jgi:hypothetical protein
MNTTTAATATATATTANKECDDDGGDRGMR